MTTPRTRLRDELRQNPGHRKKLGNPMVILYSTTLHTWEVWKESRPLGHGSLDACRWAYPDALPVDARQHALAQQDGYTPGPDIPGDPIVEGEAR